MGDLIAAPQKAHEGEGVVEMMVETTSNNMETGEKMNVMTDMGIFHLRTFFCVQHVII